MQSKYFLFTRFENHGSLSTEEVQAALEPLCSYYAYQKEISPETQREHLQGYVVLKQRCRLRTFVSRFPCHAEPRKGTHLQAKTYCTKEESRVAGPWFGGMEPVNEGGRRRDLQEFTSALLSGTTNYELLETGYGEQMAKYPRFMPMVRITKLQHEVFLELPVFEPRINWQWALCQTLAAAPSKREVLWRWESTGNVGKSYFAMHFKPCESFIITGGKHADIHYAYQFEKYVFFDWARSNEGVFPYGLVEQFKNGYFLSTKYESIAKRFQIPHVIVFANFAPDVSQMSLDRWNIENIE